LAGGANTVLAETGMIAPVGSVSIPLVGGMAMAQAAKTWQIAAQAASRFARGKICGPRGVGSLWSLGR